MTVKTQQKPLVKTKRNKKKTVKYRTAHELESIANNYFDTAEIPTITGLAIALGCNSRQGLIDLQSNKLYRDVVKKAKLRVEHSYETRLAKGQNIPGIIFILKNMGWSDNQTTTQNQNITVEHVVRLPQKKPIDQLPTTVQKLDKSKEVRIDRN